MGVIPATGASTDPCCSGAVCQSSELRGVRVGCSKRLMTCASIAPGRSWSFRESVPKTVHRKTLGRGRDESLGTHPAVIIRGGRQQSRETGGERRLVSLRGWEKWQRHSACHRGLTRPLQPHRSRKTGKRRMTSRHNRTRAHAQVL